MPETLTMEGALDSLRISDTEAQVLLGELESLTLGHKASDKRETKRVPAKHRARVIIEVRPIGGTPITYLARPRNISRTGMAILHGNYIHNDVVCHVQLKLGGELATTPARVVRCRYVSGSIHEVGIKFDKPLATGG